MKAEYGGADTELTTNENNKKYNSLIKYIQVLTADVKPRNHKYKAFINFRTVTRHKLPVTNNRNRDYARHIFLQGNYPHITFYLEGKALQL